MTLTYQEWLRLPNVENGTDEVVDGELRIVATRLYPHAEVIGRLIRCLRSLPKDTEVYGSGIGLMISSNPLTCRTPDLVVYRQEAMVVRDGLFWSAPRLIVEVLSPSENRRRKEEKLADYAAIGVPEVWLVSPEAETIEVRLLKEGIFERKAILTEGTLQPSDFPGVVVFVESVFQL